ncbi:2-amino-thiazoline-4-carboxylic acid hydrolase [Chlorella sorokiniana]|uniref:2-amino-thiazoline-4-carboxylic acid hydrolase n=1 Tax=Chlorella sorokiniana TaxID=3076 RepID=A0A2P6TVI3_CHLSO|nr:2-amino-thiazoline-4-carboxylic acid hydrolase [Chlorella sorokiniana]|eukprot:PRW58067.1 2-amino-thiazoline-4-carboxylic acid hydrolase [Chlorella sorokiniana]
MQRFAGSAVDERAETHLQVAALVLASHTALLPWLRDEQEVLKIIGEHMGGRTHALLRFLLRATKFLHRDGYAALSARLRGLQWDLGRGFETELQLGLRESTLTITRCFYHDLFSEVGQPQLAACCCCSQDKVWFESAHYKGVEAGRTAAISTGDPHCCFRVRRLGAAEAAGGAGS